MIGRKRLLRVIAVLSVAIATGQTVESLRSSAAVRSDIGAGRPDVRAWNEHLPRSASLYPEGAGQLPDLMGITPVAAAAQAESDGCSPSLALTPRGGAMIELSLHAPCNVGERIVIRHAGISFTGVMGLNGRLSVSLPALEREALVAAYFEGSAVALASVSVPELAGLARVAFQAPHPVEFELRAEEGETIHVGGTGKAGRVVTLGDDGVLQPMLAQVYTFPGVDLGASDLSVEVRITEQTCGRSFVAETRIAQGGEVTAQSASFAVPICGTSGDILVLKNLVPATTLAAPR